MDSQGFRDRLLVALKRLGESDAEVGRQVGVKSRTTIGNWKEGPSEPGVSELLALCRVLATDPNWLTSWSDAEGFPEDERELLFIWRKLGASDRNMIRTIMERMRER